MCEAGAINRLERGRVKVLDPRVLAAQKKKGCEISKACQQSFRDLLCKTTEPEKDKQCIYNFFQP